MVLDISCVTSHVLDLQENLVTSQGSSFLTCASGGGRDDVFAGLL